MTAKINANDPIETGILIMEDERRRISRDLHDGPAQILSQLSLRLDVVCRLMEVQPQRALEEIQKIRRSLDNSVNDVRRLVYDLRPVAVDEIGVIQSIQQFCQVRAKDWRVEIEFETDGNVTDDFSPAKRLVIYRIFQEILNNIKKHAQAKLIKVSLNKQGKNLILTVIDDGKGFDPNAIYEGHYGLTSIRERAQYLDGELTIESKIGQGSKFVATLPVYAQ